MSDAIEQTKMDRTQAERRLAVARALGDVYAEARTLVDLAVIARRDGDVWALIDHARAGWETSERNCLWDQLARLALLFGDVAYSGRDYHQCFDHYANACAYAVMAGSSELGGVITRIDDVLTEMLATGRATKAAALCEFLLAYEAAGGLGRAESSFVAHFRRRQEQAQAQVRADLVPTGSRQN